MNEQTNERTNEQTNERTNIRNGRTDAQKDENYIPLGINAGGIKMKGFMGVERGELYSTPPIPIDYVHRDEIGEIVSSILLKGIQKLQMARLFSIPLIIT